jgi:hypothetical protein
MTIKQFDKIIEVVRNGGTVIVDKSTNEFNSFDEITEYSDIEDIIKYSVSGGCSFYIKNGDKPWYELESI